MELTLRRREILKAIVEDYVVTTRPVSSESVAGRHGKGLSPATIRSEMNVLEEAGLIFQPHTSAGRVPSDEGYRYYIEHLMEPGALSPSEILTILHQFHQVEARSEQWLRLVMALLANHVGGASVATPPLAHQARIRQISLTPLSDRHAVLTLVLNSGKVSQQLLAVEAVYEGRDLVAVGRWLGESLANRTAGQCNEWAQSAHGMDSAVARAVATEMERADEESIHGLYYEGIRHIAAQPEFSTGEKLKPVLDALELRRALGQWLRQVSSRGGIQYVIGREFPIEEIRHCSVVISGYGDPREPAGVVGVLGPTRMAYWRAAPMVQYMANLMGRLVAEAYL